MVPLSQYFVFRTPILNKTSRIHPYHLSGLPINLLDPEISFCERHAAANRIGDAIRHLNHREARVEAEAEVAQVAPGVLGIVEGPRSGS